MQEQSFKNNKYDSKCENDRCEKPIYFYVLYLFLWCNSNFTPG